MRRGRLSILALAFGALLVAAPAMLRAETKSFPVVTGENWVKSSPAERLAFITGLTTMIELEKEVQGANPPADQKTLIPAWESGLSRFSLKQIVDALDNVYKKKPELKAKPVVEVLWYEVAFPQTASK